MLRLLLAAGLIVPVPLGAAEAEPPLADLLRELAPAPVAAGSVEVLGWIERNGARPELVITLVPHGAVKLVADPGVSATPVPRAGVDWHPAAAATSMEPGSDYFAVPPTLRLPFAAEDGRPVEAEVEYAYCVVDYQCLFGNAKVTAPTEMPRG